MQGRIVLRAAATRGLLRGHDIGLPGMSGESAREPVLQHQPGDGGVRAAAAWMRHDRVRAGEERRE